MLFFFEMEIIDVHTHVPFGNLNVVAFARSLDIDCSIDGLISDLDKNSISTVFAITDDRSDATPLELSQVNLIPKNSRIKWIGGINPYKSGEKEVVATDKALSEKIFVGLKVYLGYYPFFPQDKVYEKFYGLAQKNDVPVFFHTGDTFGKEYRVKYAHPLNIDDVAVDFPDLKIVICHFGNPWCVDAAEVVYKNENVYADLSGFEIGKFDVVKRASALARRITPALDYCGFDKLLYGSDWPLVGLGDYVSLIKSIIPNDECEKVFSANAKKLFKLD